jgi:hypothetical protein
MERKSSTAYETRIGERWLGLKHPARFSILDTPGRPPMADGSLSRQESRSVQRDGLSTKYQAILKENHAARCSNERM